MNEMAIAKGTHSSMSSIGPEWTKKPSFFGLA
jgi:hypothetical protein